MVVALVQKIKGSSEKFFPLVSTVGWLCSISPTPARRDIAGQQPVHCLTRSRFPGGRYIGSLAEPGNAGNPATLRRNHLANHPGVEPGGWTGVYTPGGPNPGNLTFPHQKQGRFATLPCSIKVLVILVVQSYTAEKVGVEPTMSAGVPQGMLGTIHLGTSRPLCRLRTSPGGGLITAQTSQEKPVRFTSESRRS